MKKQTKIILSALVMIFFIMPLWHWLIGMAFILMRDTWIVRQSSDFVQFSIAVLMFVAVSIPVVWLAWKILELIGRIEE